LARRYSLFATFIFALVLTDVSLAQYAIGQHSEEFQGRVTRQLQFKYQLFLPQGYGENPDRKWPLIMYLDGGSGRGNDIEKLREPGYGLRSTETPFFCRLPTSASAG
jgi:predicted peptidase